MREITAQHAGVEPLAQPDVEAGHAVDVVADEDERRAPPVYFAVELEGEIEERMAAQHGMHRPEHRVPLAAAEAALLLLAMSHDRRIKPDARVVDEHLPVYFSDVDRSPFAGGDHLE